MAAPQKSTTTDLAIAGPPFWLSPAAYWLPAHYQVSAWTTHAPFAAWLVEKLRPASIVELGTHFGFSCFTFAEAAHRLGLSTTIDALDSWEGDDHAGFYGSDVYQYASETAKMWYPQSVRLVRGYFSESRRAFEDHSVDLLHIDGRHGYEDVLEDFSSWVSVVRDGGIVLFHDIAERENGFGVWRLWEELAQPGRSFAFTHGHGLGVLAVGEVPTGPLGELFAADDVTADRIRADFARLGATVERQRWLETLPAELDSVRAVARHHEVRQAELEVELAGRTREVERLTASTSWRVTAPLRSLGRRLRHDG